MITGELSNGFIFELDEKKVFTHKFRRLMTRTIPQPIDDNLEEEERREKEKAQQIRILRANEELIEYLIGETGVEKLEDYVMEKTGEEIGAAEFDALIIEMINAAKKDNEEIKK